MNKSLIQIIVAAIAMLGLDSCVVVPQQGGHCGRPLRYGRPLPYGYGNGYNNGYGRVYFSPDPYAQSAYEYLWRSQAQQAQRGTGPAAYGRW